MRTIWSWIARSMSCAMWGRVVYEYTHSFRCPHRKKSGTVMSGERTCHGMPPKCEVNLWKRLRTTSSMLLCDYHARFFTNFSCLCRGCLNVAQLSDVDCAEMVPLFCEYFSTCSSWSTVRTVSDTASAFKLTYQQQSPVAWRNHTMPKNIKLLPGETLCPNDGLCFVIKMNSCSSLRYAPPPDCY
jgi:hypothetical protein